jgi:hypothetical protein
MALGRLLIALGVLLLSLVLSLALWLVNHLRR